MGCLPLMGPAWDQQRSTAQGIPWKVLQRLVLLPFNTLVLLLPMPLMEPLGRSSAQVRTGMVCMRVRILEAASLIHKAHRFPEATWVHLIATALTGSPIKSITMSMAHWSPLNIAILDANEAVACRSESWGREPLCRLDAHHPYASLGTFTSRIFDAGQLVDWSKLS